MQGIIKSLKNGFGFIAPEGEGEKDLFFHASDVVGEFNDLREGDTVSFEKVPSDRGGKKAGSVTKVQPGMAGKGNAAPAEPMEAPEEGPEDQE